MRSRPFGTDGKQFLAALRQQFTNFLFAFLKMLSGIRNRVAFDQNIFAAEFIVRIASFRRVAVRLHTVMEIKNLASIAQRIVDFSFCPDIERAFGGVGMTKIADPSYDRAVGIFGGEKSAIF